MITIMDIITTTTMIIMNMTAASMGIINSTLYNF